MSDLVLVAQTIVLHMMRRRRLFRARSSPVCSPVQAHVVVRSPLQPRSPNVRALARATDSGQAIADPVEQPSIPVGALPLT